MLLALGTSLLCACSTQYLNVTGVAYQSIHSKGDVSRAEIPTEAKIIVHCLVDRNGAVDVVVQNNTDKIMVVDRTKSFFQNASGVSTIYYDPTVTVNTQSSTQLGTTGVSVNMGSIANAAGVGSSAVGKALAGVNVGGSRGNATTNTSTTYLVDQPQVSVPPHGQASMGRTFFFEGVGTDFLDEVSASTATDVNSSYASPAESYAACNICVSFSVDEGKTYDTILTDIYANTLLVSKVNQTGKVNDALRGIYLSKPDALMEPWYLLYFHSNLKENNFKVQATEILNYK